ncbi:hypothetical protein AJ79_02744 [Helicocarpus griseus UAMH5409]|uniref:chitinase n=1 Tax=Helicocarpus griseus UAMH5409 TaxID=1447875 RepID=A0A2B7Y201_9EURO|nr:hypothetical protein AJ79_02744 [Helicocarpus griseus UAMH5409]
MGEDFVVLLRTFARTVVKMDATKLIDPLAQEPLLANDMLAISKVGIIIIRVILFTLKDQYQPLDGEKYFYPHLNYAFAQINPNDNTLMTTQHYDEEFIRAFTDLKKRKSSLKCFISVGGWDAGSKVFSNMARSKDTRKIFINSVWADDRGGAKEDFETYVQLLKELRETVGSRYGITVALPASYWYLRGFDVKGMAEYVDWFNIMSYDIHGTWDGNSKWTKEVINPHTSLEEISNGLDLLWRNSVPPEKVSLGLGFYGRSFKLADPSCTTPGCPFKRSGDANSGGAEAGECTLNSDYIQSTIRGKLDYVGQGPML